ncbi:MGMT family protein [Microbacterium sp.]
MEAALSLLEEVRRIVDAVPSGQVITYGEIASLVGVHPRQAGRLVARLEDDSPWWRVVYSDGSPATCHDGAARTLLREEETPMCGERVDVRRLLEQRRSS